MLVNGAVQFRQRRRGYHQVRRVLAVGVGSDIVGEMVATVIETIASDNGPQWVVEAGLGDKVIPALGSAAKSDAALSRMLGKRFDAVATVKVGTLL